MVDGFVETMIKLMKRIDEFDQIVIEASEQSNRLNEPIRFGPHLPAPIIPTLISVSLLEYPVKYWYTTTQGTWAYALWSEVYITPALFY